ncbi:LLM class flavin-dependent oxidoreductase [Streptomyces iakyrus]|uniref:LLM class flavin-dependent oxidoreductase n=1 Tax=Streptomyces iakyrus TaxID=68219 RepID=UPI00381E6C0E
MARRGRHPLQHGTRRTPRPAHGARPHRRGHPKCPPLVEHYRAVGTAAGHPADRLRLGRSGHFYVGRTSQGARDDVFPFYKEYVRPKPLTGRGFHIGRAEFDAAAVPFGALMVGSPQELIDKILAEREVLGIDFGDHDLATCAPCSSG